MASKTFTTGTVIDSAWLNDVNNAVYNKLGVFASDFEGYDPTGVSDSTTALQSAINIANLQGTHTVFVKGKININKPLTFTTALVLVGLNGEELFTNQFGTAPNKINCSAVSGYTFDQPDGAAGVGALTLKNLCFDGSLDGGSLSTTWQGLVQASTTLNNSTFWLTLDNILVGNGDSPTGLLNLTGAVFTDLRKVYFSNWRKGIGLQAKAGSYLGTTLSLTKCYFNSLRQAYEIYDSFTDVTFNQCVIESCVVAGASMKGTITFNQLYSENLGYDPTGTGVVTGLTPRNFGINDATPIVGNVSAAFTARHGQMIFNSPTIQATTGGKKWFEGVGRFSTAGYGGKLFLNNPHFAAGTLNTLFSNDDVVSSRDAFEYYADVKMGAAIITHADARLITKGRVPIQWSDGSLRIVEIDAGLFTTPRSTPNPFNYYTNSYPNGGQNRVGDRIFIGTASLQAGAPDSWVCTTAGTPGKWDTNSFLPLTIAGTMTASGGTFNIPVVFEEPGFIYVYEVMASAFGAGTSWSATIKAAQYASGASASVDESTAIAGGIGVTFSYNNPIVLTNNSTNTLSVYARLTSVGRTHT